MTCLFLASWKQTHRYVAVGSLFETLGEADYSDAKSCDTTWYCNTTPQTQMQIPPSVSAHSTDERARPQEDYLLQMLAVSGILNMCTPDQLATNLWCSHNTLRVQQFARMTHRTQESIILMITILL